MTGRLRSIVRVPGVRRRRRRLMSVQRRHIGHVQVERQFLLVVTHCLVLLGGAGSGVEAEVEDEAWIVQLSHCDLVAFLDLHHEAVESARITLVVHTGTVKYLKVSNLKHLHKIW